ncbi:MAG: hypothetical protein ACKV2Q_27355 [Planctomycetaceae bacterium]
MNTSLVFCVLALSSSWTPPSAPDLDPSRVFARAEPIGLFDEVTAPESEATVGRTTHGFWSAYNSANQGSSSQSRKGTNQRPFPSLLRAQRDAIIRAQSPEVRVADGMQERVQRTFAPIQNPMPVPGDVPTPTNPPSSSSPSSPSSPELRYEPEETTQPPTGQPFLPPVGSEPFTTVPPPGVSTWGANGPQPYRLGYSLWGDIGWLPSRRTSLPNDSKFEVFEANIGLNHTIPTWWAPWLFSLEHQLGYRSWQGPKTAMGADLPSSVYRLGWDLRLETPLNSQFAPFAALLAFNPSINSDFDHSLHREAFNFDGRGVLVWQIDPRFRIALGAEFWDRLNDRVIPHAGFVWLPNDRWEFNIMWPKSRIQYYCGNYTGEDVWLYASGEYHVESYEIDSADPMVSRTDQIELEDYRIMIGLRKSNPIMSGFIEGGWVFGRDVDQRFGPDFDINSGFIGRIGIRF